MAEVYETLPTQPETLDGSASPIARRIAQQDSIITVLKERLDVARQQQGYQFHRRREVYEIERVLAAARDERAALIHDRKAANDQ